MTLSTARTFRCTQCGGAIPLASLAAAQACPFCHRPQLLPEGLLAELSRYREGFDHESAHRAAHDIARSQWERWYGGQSPQHQKQTTYLLLAFVYLGFPLLAWAVLAVAQALGVHGEDSKYVSFVIIGLFFSSILGWQYWSYVQRQRRAQSDTTVAAEVVACPACGAPHPLHAGNLSDRCRHCGAPMIPSRTAIAHVIDAAVRATRRAAMARYHSERHATRAMSASSSTYQTFAIAWALGLPAVGITVAMIVVTFQVLTRDPIRESALPTLGVGWMVFIGAATVVAMVVRDRRATRARWRGVVETMVGQLGGQVLAGTGETVAWLDAFWPADFPVIKLMVGRCYQAAAVAPHGFPCLIHVDPIPAFSNNVFQPHIEVLVAADVPGATNDGWPQPRGDAAATVAALIADGFAVDLHAAGLTAQATYSTLLRLRRTPEMAAVLVKVASRLAHVAEVMGGTPAVRVDG